MSPEPRSLSLHRRLLLVGGGAYLGWWCFVRVTLPESFNPIGSRIAVVAVFVALYGATYVSKPFARTVDLWLGGAGSILMAHYLYLFDRNHADMNWVVGMYITVVAVCAILQTSRSLLLYSVCTAVLSGAALLLRQGGTQVVFLPGVLTLLLVANIALHSRLRLVARLQESHARVEKLFEEGKRAELALRQANKELESFSYSVAHDLRGPLRGINGFSRLLQEDYGDKLDGEGRAYLDRIATAADRMGYLIDALLGLARVARREIVREEVDLSEHAEAFFRQLRLQSPERDVDITIQPGLVAHGDPSLLRALLENLLGNAWKFTERKGAARVELGREIVDGRPAFFVRDNGAGFDMALADKLFSPFKRLHRESEFAGTGIGLATVSRIAERHGGRAWARGAVDEGATFYFTLDDRAHVASGPTLARVHDDGAARG